MATPKKKPRLNDKQKRFVSEYLIDLNATQAAIRAGYSSKPTSAEVHGLRLLRNSRVAELLSKRQAEIERRTGISVDRVIREIARVAFADIRSFVTWGPNGVTMMDSEMLDEDDAACVAEVTETTTKDGGSRRFKLHDKIAALTLLAKRLGLTPEHLRHAGEDGGPIQYEDITPQDEIERERQRLLEESVNRIAGRLAGTPSGNGAHGSPGGNGSHVPDNGAE